MEIEERLRIIAISTGTGRALCNVNGGANETSHDIPVERRKERKKKLRLAWRRQKGKHVVY